MKRAMFFFILTSVFILANARAEETPLMLAAKERAEDEALDSYRQKLKQVIAPQEDPFASEVDGCARFMPKRGAESQSGKVGLIESAAEYSYQAKLFGELPMQFGVGAEYIGIDNTTAVKLPARLTTTAFGIEATLPVFNLDKAYFTIGLAPTFATDDWGINSSAFRMLQRYFFIYQPNEKWTFICGVAVLPEYDTQALPIAGFIYKPNDRLTFNIIPKNPEISYLLTDKLVLFGEADIESNEFQVNKNDVSKVMLEYNEMYAGLGLRYKPNKNISAALSVGSSFNRSLKYRHDYLGKVVIKDGMYTQFRGEMYF